MQSIYGFSLLFAVPAHDTESDDLVDALARYGSDDALVGTCVPGRLVLQFDRVADTSE